MSVSIYGLYNSKELITHIRYIGQAKDPVKRLISHRFTKDGTQRSQWIQSVQDSDGVVSMIILDSTETREDAFVKENAWILFGKSLGWQLVNGTTPGEHRSLLAPEFAMIRDAAQAIGLLSDALRAEKEKADTDHRELQIERYSTIAHREAAEFASLEAGVLADRMHEIESMLTRVNLDKDIMLGRWYRAYLFTTLILLASMFSIMLLMDFRMGNDTSVAGRIEAYAILVTDIFMPFCFAWIGWLWFGMLPFHRLSILDPNKDLYDCFVEWEQSLNPGEKIHWRSVRDSMKFTAGVAAAIIIGLILIMLS